MKKSILLYLFALTMTFVYAQESEKAPDYNRTQQKFTFQNQAEDNVVALWDLQFDYSLDDSAPGNLSNGLHFNDEFWIAEWNSDTIVRMDNDGLLLEVFTIPTLTGMRAITWDGTSLWISNNTQTVFEVNPDTKLVMSTITIPFTDGVRFLTYDNTADGGNGGFWVGNFNTNIELYSKTGTLLETITTDTHTLGGMYGAAVDNVSPGGPYLWVFHQAGEPLDGLITQLKLPEGTPTGVGRDVQIDLGTEEDLAGGMFITDSWNPDGGLTLGGVLQGTPDRIFGYDLAFEEGPVINAAATEILSPNSACGLTDAESIIVNVENTGAVAIENIQIDFYQNGTLLESEMITSTIEPGQSLDYTFAASLDMSVTGLYDFDVEIIVNDDINNSDDRTSKFVSNKAFAAPPVEATFDDLPLETTLFTDLYNLGDIPFQVNAGGTPSTNTGPIGDLLGGTGQYIYMETSGRDRGDRAILTTNCLDFSGISSPELVFGYHAFGDGIEYLSVDVTDDAGVVTNLLLLEGQQQTSNDDPWGLEFLDLSAFIGQTIEISFTGEIGPNGDIFNSDIALDEIAISGVSAANEIKSLELFTIAPNPATDKLFVQIELATQNEAELRLFNSLGQVVAFINDDSLVKENYELDLVGFAPGMYTLQLIVDHQMATKKVIVK